MDSSVIISKKHVLSIGRWSLTVLACTPPTPVGVGGTYWKCLQLPPTPTELKMLLKYFTQNFKN